jgi:hypothetical protein
MAFVTGWKKGLDIVYVEHNEIEYKVCELESGDHEVFLWVDGPRDFLGRCMNGNYKSYSIEPTLSEAIKYIEKLDIKKV